LAVAAACLVATMVTPLTLRFDLVRTVSDSRVCP